MSERMHKQLGQYFTTNTILKEKVFEFILNKPSTILEPSIGRGDLVQFTMERNKHVQFDMYELDEDIKVIEQIDKGKVVYGDFMKKEITKSYTTIIGNPPYVRTKTGNLYVEFTDKCFQLLQKQGELIFIVPSDFFKLTNASSLLNEMMSEGSFTHIYHPHNEKLFENASIDVIVFRYCKDKTIEKTVWYNDELCFIQHKDGFIRFTKEKPTSSILFQDCFDIYVGMMSGKENVFKHTQLGNIDILNAEGQIERYIYIDTFPSDNRDINQYLVKHKDELINRRIRSFDETNWFQWGAPRNKRKIEQHMNKECIYIHTLTRKTKIAFMGKVQYFGGGLIVLIPKRECNLSTITEYLNTHTFKDSFMFSGRFKIGHRQMRLSTLPTDYI